MRPLYTLTILTTLALAACGDETTGPAPATQLVFTTQPANDTIGSIPLVGVTAQTAQGATATGFVGTVILSLGANPGSAVLSGTTSVVATNGVASFPNLSINKAEEGYTLTATAGALTVTSAPFDIAEVSQRYALRYESQALNLGTGTIAACIPFCATSDPGDLHIAYNSVPAIHSAVFQHSTRQIAHLTGRSYSSVHVADTAGAGFSASLNGAPFDNTRTVLIRTSAGTVYKLGNPTEFGVADSVRFHVARLN